MTAVLNTSTQMQHSPSIVDGLAEIADYYDAFIVDLWGVVHNGKVLFDGVVPCLQKLKELNKTVILLSNAPRSFGSVIERISELGLPRQLYDFIKTSGDYALEYIRRHPAKSYYHIGVPEKDSSLLAGIGMNPVEEMHEAEVIICSNLQENRLELSDYHADFKKAAAKEIPMVCANPDVIVNYGDSIVYCSGALALEYEKFGGKVVYFGKPDSKVYKDLINKHPDKKFLALGDSLVTDIKGAMSSGIDSVLILSGIHKQEISKSEQQSWQLFDEYQAYPNYMMSEFSW